VWVRTAPLKPSVGRFALYMKLMNLVIGLVLLFAVACSAITQAPGQSVKVEGKAMEPELKEGDRILVSKSVDKLDRGDIVLFYYPGDQSRSYIKRIIGLPKDEIEIQEGTVVLNGKKLDEPYVDAKNNQALLSRKPVIVPDDSYFVMGDNRDHSNDSRFWGSLKREFIYAKVVRKNGGRDLTSNAFGLAAPNKALQLTAR
jgi:signal peptidase I